MKRYLILFSGLALILFVLPCASATNILPSSLEYMTNFCDTIVIGNVMNQYSYWEDKVIYTNVVISVEQFEKNTKNERASTIEIQFPGGQVGDVRFEVDEAPMFDINDKVLLFLKSNSSNYIIYGLNYGVCKIAWDETLQKEFIDGPLFQKEVHYNPETKAQIENINLLGRIELPIFLEQLRKHLD